MKFVHGKRPRLFSAKFIHADASAKEVTHINSFMAWVGGEKAFVTKFSPVFRWTTRYIEVGGAGWVLFHKPPGNDFEVFNDFNGNLVNLYRCVREQPESSAANCGICSTHALILNI